MVVEITEKDVLESLRKVDPRQVIRLNYLTNGATHLTEDEIDGGLIDRALKSEASVSLTDLVNDLAKNFAYREAKLLLNEFLEKAKILNLSKKIVYSFVNKLKDLDEDSHLQGSEAPDMSKEELEMFQAQLVKDIVGFLNNDQSKLRGAVSLYDYLRTIKLKYPFVKVGDLFSLEISGKVKRSDKTRIVTLKSMLCDKIDESFDDVAADAYRTKFDEDARGFVMGFMMGKVITYDKVSGKMNFNAVAFRNLVEYVDSIGLNIEKIDLKDKTDTNGGLYQWLYYDCREMARYLEEQKVSGMRAETKKKVALASDIVLEKENNDDEKILFDPDFDVSDFYRKNIAPILFRFNSKKHKEIKSAPEPILFHEINTSKHKEQVIFSAKHVRYFRDLVKEYENNPKNFADRIKGLFGYSHSPLWENDLKEKNDQLFAEDVARYLNVAEGMYWRNLSEAMSQRADGKERIQDDCRYFDEILKCRDLSKLITWIAYPERFVEEYPQYEGVSDYLVYHQAMVMFKEFLFVSERLSSPRYLEVYENRECIENFLKEALHIESIASFEIPYRLLREVVEPGNKPTYLSVCDSEQVAAFVDEDTKKLSKEVFENPDKKMVAYDGKEYELMPLEKTKFTKVRMEFDLFPPLSNAAKNGVNGNEHQKYSMEVLVYTGDSHYVHVKDMISMLLSEGRGKDVSDENRCLMVFANQQDEEAFKVFWYQNYAGNNLSIDDSKNNIDISAKKVTSAHVGSNKKFRAARSFKIAKKLNFKAKRKFLNSKNELVERTVNKTAILEIQSSSLSSLFSYNISHYSPASHSTYRAKRAWFLMSYYFNPQVWGDKYQRYIDQGPMFNND